MIPKIIHYCWFGRNPKSNEVLACIASWKKILPDYEIKEWNEDNYDIHKNQYMHDAYKERKWAFVSDYARIDIVYMYGGIYLDTDVEVVKSFDNLLSEKMFCGFESRDPIMDRNHMVYEESVNFGLGYGAVKGHPVLRDLLDFYRSLNFYNADDTLNLVACPHYQTLILKNYGLKPNRKTQRLKSVLVFSPEYFCPQSNLTDEMLYLTNNTYSIHHFSGTWIQNRPKQKVINVLRKIVGYKCAVFMAKVICKPICIFKLYRNK